MAKAQQQKSGIQIYKRLMGYAKPYWPIFVLAIISTIAYSGFSASFTYLIKPLMDKGFIAKEPEYIRTIPLIFVSVFLARGISGFFSNYAMSYIGKSIVMVLRQQIFNKFMTLPASYYDNSTSGELLSAIIYNTTKVTDACTNAISVFVQNSFFAIGTLVVMCIISWRLTLIIFAVAPIFIWLMKTTNRRQRRLNLRIQDNMGEVTHIAEEAIEGYQVVKTFGGQEYERNKFKQVTEANRAREMKVVVAQGINTPAVQLVGVCALSLMIYFAAAGIGGHTISTGGFAAMLAAMMSLLRPMKSLTNMNAIIQQGIAGAESVFALLDREDERDTGQLEISRSEGALTFKQVDFIYPGTSKKVLRDINFAINSGESIALVGRSGAGKSSLVSLIMRFYDISSGDILLDDNSVYDIKMESLRDQIALVSQNVTLFNDTIAKNIAYGLMRDASDEDVVKAATAAHAMEFIRELPQGIHTLVGENGVLLSGGQRQRIAIARAILKDAPILILDEATSALDTESERHIQAALEEVMRNRTTVMIAHRLSTIEKADRIFVLENGEIVEMGHHGALLNKGGVYAKLHKMQFGQEHILEAV